MPFRRKGAPGLTARLDVRVAPAEKEQLGGDRSRCGPPRRRAGAAARARAAGRVPYGRHDHPGAAAPRGLLKMVHVESGGAYRQQTAELLTMLRAAIGKLAGGQ